MNAKLCEYARIHTCIYQNFNDKYKKKMCRFLYIYDCKPKYLCLFFKTVQRFGRRFIVTRIIYKGQKFCVYSQTILERMVCGFDIYIFKQLSKKILVPTRFHAIFQLQFKIYLNDINNKSR